MTETKPRLQSPAKSRPIERPYQANVKLKPTKTMPIRAGAFELRKSGVSRYDLKDPYHILVTATLPKAVRHRASRHITGN